MATIKTIKPAGCCEDAAWMMEDFAEMERRQKANLLLAKIITEEQTAFALARAEQARRKHKKKV